MPLACAPPPPPHSPSLPLSLSSLSLGPIQRAAKSDMQTLHHECIMLQKHVTQEVDGVREGQNNHVLTTTLLERKINELESEVRRALLDALI